MNCWRAKNCSGRVAPIRIERPDGSGDLIFVGNLPYGGYGSNQSNAGISSTGRLGAFSAIPNVRLVEQKLIRMINEE